MFISLREEKNRSVAARAIGQRGNPPRENQTTPLILFSAKTTLLALFIASTPTMYPL